MPTGDPTCPMHGQLPCACGMRRLLGMAPAPAWPSLPFVPLPSLPDWEPTRIPLPSILDKGLDMFGESRVGISDDRLPPDCYVSHHEARGYDSPDRWFEARVGKTLLGKFGNQDQAVEACIEATRGKTWYELLDEEP